MPTFCRHNRLLQNCTICAREQDLEPRPVISPGGGRRARASGAATPAPAARPASPGRSRSRGGRAAAGLRVSQLARGVDDGYRSNLAPGLRSSADAARLAEELAWAQARLGRLAVDPPGLYAVLADQSVAIEERSWLAFQIAYLGPLDGPAPFAAIERARSTWASGEDPGLADAEAGPRGAHEPGRPARTPSAYRAWAARSGSQAAAFTGEPGWSAERRFARAFERLALPGFDRGARFELLVTLGQTGCFDMQAGSLALGGSDAVTVAAKRLLGIGDPMLLQRRGADLAAASGLSLAALDVGFYNWEQGARATLGMDSSVEPDPETVSAVQAALEL
jgi:hypothetical protein